MYKKFKKSLKHSPFVSSGNLTIFGILFMSIVYAALTATLFLFGDGLVRAIPNSDYYYYNGYFYTDASCTSKIAKRGSDTAYLTTMAEAVAQIPSGKTIYMMSNYAVQGTALEPKSETVTVSEKDVTLKRHSSYTSGSLFNVGNYGSLTMSLADNTAFLTIDGDDITTSGVNGGAFNVTNGELYLEGTYDSQSGIDRMIIAGNDAVNGGGIYATGTSTVQLENCMIADNNASSSGGGIYNDITDGQGNMIFVGTMVIKDNTSGDSTSSNLYVNTTPVFVDDISSNSEIHVSSSSVPKDVARLTSGDITSLATYFAADDTEAFSTRVNPNDNSRLQLVANSYDNLYWNGTNFFTDEACSTGNTGLTTLADAVDAMNSGGTIWMEAAYTVSSGTQTVNLDKNLTIKRWVNSQDSSEAFGNDYVFKILVGATMNISETSGHTLIFDGNKANVTSDNGMFYVEGGTLNLNNSSSRSNNTIIIQNSTAYDRGGGIHVDEGYSGGAVSGTLNMYYTTVQNNAVTRPYGLNYGAGVLIEDNVSSTISHCTFTGNTGASGVDIYNGAGTVTISGCTFTDNGNGIETDANYTSAGTRTISNCTFTRNGIVLNGSGGTNTFTSCEITEASNGGVRISSETNTFTNCEITNNAANISGGGVAISSGTNTFTNCEITGNTASYGGGMHISGGTTYLSGITTITGNTSDNLYLNTGETVNVSGLSSGSSIGVKTYRTPTESTPVIVGTNAASAAVAGYFSSDNSNYLIKYDSGSITLNARPSNLYWNGTNFFTDEACSTGNTGLTTLSDAVDLLASEGTIWTKTAYTVSSGTQTVNATKDVTIKRHSSYNNGPMIEVSGGTLNISEVSGKSLVFDGNKANVTCTTNYSGAFKVSGGTLNLNSSSTGSNTIIVQNGSCINSGGGISVTSGTLNMYYTTIQNNAVTSSTYGNGGGGVYLGNSSGTNVISNCLITGNTAPNYGGGLFIYGNVTNTISECTFTGNTGGSSGGAIYIFGGTNSISDCLVTNNESYFGGAGICVNSGTNTISDCEITGNTSTHPSPVSVSGVGLLYDVDAPAGAISLVGEVNITGNTLSNGSERNLNVATNRTVDISGLTSGSSIGVTTSSTNFPVKFATGASSSSVASYFSSDTGLSAITFNSVDNCLYLETPNIYYNGGTFYVDEACTTTLKSGSSDVTLLSDAVNLIPDNSIIWIMSKYTVSSAETVRTAKNITVKRYANSLDPSESYTNGPMFEITSGGTLTINENSNNSSFIFDGNKDNAVCTTDYSGAFYVNGGTLNLNNSTSGSSNTIIIQNCKCTNYGGGISVSSGTLSMYYTTVQNNEVTSSGGYGGGLYIASSGTYSLGGTTTITSNTAGESANNLCLYTNCTVNVSGLTSGSSIGVSTYTAPITTPITFGTNATSATFADYFTSDNSSYVVMHDSSSSTLVLSKPTDLYWNGTNFFIDEGCTKNTGLTLFSDAVDRVAVGGTIWMKAAYTMSSGVQTVNADKNVTVKRHSSYTNGPMIEVSGGTLSISETSGNSLIFDGVNIACTNSYSGAFKVSGGTLNLNDSSSRSSNTIIIQNCKCTNYGGGIGSSSGIINMYYTTLQDNIATSSTSKGGNMYLSNGTGTVSNCTFTGGSDGYGGGGMFLDSGVYTVSDCTISNNYGGVFLWDGTNTLVNCTITNNSNPTFGGMCMMYGTQTLRDCTITGNTCTGNPSNNSIGAGIFHECGTLYLEGTMTISGNIMTQNGEENNLFFYDTHSFGPRTVDVSGLSAGSNIGVRSQTAPTASSPITCGINATSAAVAGYFSSDDSNYMIRYNSGSITLNVIPSALYWNGTNFFTDEGCSTGNTELTKLSDAVDMIASDGTIWMKAAYTVSSGTETVNADKSIQVRRHSSYTTGPMIEVSGGTLNISEASGKTFHFNGNNISTSSVRGGAFLVSGGTLNLNTSSTGSSTITILNCSSYGGGGIAVTSGSLNAYYTTIEDNTSERGGGVYLLGGTNALTNCSITGNSVGNTDGSGVFIENGTNTLTNCSITGNTGRSALLVAGGTNYLSGETTITGNTYSSQPGNLRVTNYNYLDVSGLTSGSNIGVIINSSVPFNFAKGATKTIASYFTSDDTRYIVALSGNILQIAAAPSNTYTNLYYYSGKFYSDEACTAANGYTGLTNLTQACNAITTSGTIWIKSQYQPQSVISEGREEISLSKSVLIKRHSSYKTGPMIYVSSGKRLEIMPSGSASVTLDGNKTYAACDGRQYCGAIRVEGGTLILSKTTIQNCSQATRGAGISILSNSNVQIESSTIQNNELSSTGAEGAGIYMSGNGSLAINSCTITGNVIKTSNSSNRGAGIYLGSGTGTRSINATVSNNSGAYFGGGIYIENGTNTIYGTISGNTASYRGGGIYIANGTNKLQSCQIMNNTATNDGGGVYKYSGSLVITNPNLITSNTPNNIVGSYTTS